MEHSKVIFKQGKVSCIDSSLKSPMFQTMHDTPFYWNIGEKNGKQKILSL
jgi:hypothetical protein